ncbi:MAG: HAD family hydrolase [Chloroflexota bacterium]|nr:HAD family hydrolase [Chloroflexota bacterium]
MSQPALFLDRDGTLIHTRHYPTRPDELVLYEGLGPELRALQGHGFLLALITNQSGLARGLFTDADLKLMHEHLAAELDRLGVKLHGVYHCPHHPEGVVAELAVQCSCRKPEPGMLLQAADELDIELERSWFVGDILDDVEAGNRAGCRTVLVDLGTESPPATPIRRPHYVARDTLHALRLIRAVESRATDVDMRYLPESWCLDVVGAGPRVRHSAPGDLS